MTEKRRLLMVETAASLAWFGMDACWMINARSVALALAVPTVVFSLLVFPFMRRTWASCLVTGAMTAWAVMNVFWMLHDFELLGWGLVASKVLLLVGALMLGAALLFGRADAANVLSTRFRRLRPHTRLTIAAHRPSPRPRAGGLRRARRLL